MNEFFNKFEEFLDENDYLQLKEKSNEVVDFFTTGYYFKLENSDFYILQSTQEIYVQNINFISMCKHHFLPYFGTCSIKYTPSGKILGFSKIKLIVQNLAKKLTLQEDLTEEIFSFINKLLEPQRLEILIEAQHTCMMLENICIENKITTIRIS
jgi:GTP cyclohydrolase I